MAEIERIDSAYNIPAITAESDAFQKLLQRDTQSINVLYESLEQFKGGSNVATIAKNWNSVTNSMQGAAASSSEMIEMQQQLNDVVSKYNTLQKQYNDVLSKGTATRKANKDLTDQEIRQKYEDTKATKDRTKEIIAQTDAYKQLDLQRAKAAERAKTLQAEALKSGDPTAKAEADAASAEANRLADALKKIDYAVGEQKRLVGDYNGALKVLEGELAEVNKQIAAMEKSKAAATTGVQNLGGGPIGFDTGRHAGGPTDVAGSGPTNSAIGFDAGRYKELTQQAAALSTVIGTQGKGFASTTQEIRQAERSLKTLYAAGLENTEGFKELRKSTADAAREQKNFTQAQKLLEDNVPILKAITIAAKGLAAGYAISQGAVTLFSDGNEKLEKELSKLVAIMTILQGLQEVHELLEKSNAIATIFKNSVTSAGVFITRIDTKEAIANAEAKVVQAEATLAAATAEADQLAATEVLSIAETELTVATAAATTATSTFVAVVGTAGLGLVLVAVAAAIVFIVTKFKEWTAETELDVKQQKELNDALTEQIDTLNKLNEVRSESGAKTLEDLRHQLELEEKSGKNQYAIFALKEKIAQKNAQLADNNYAQAVAKAEDKYVQDGLTGTEALHKAQSDYYEDVVDKTYKVGVVQKEVSGLLALTDKQREQKGVSSKDIEHAKERLELAKSEQKNAEENYNYYTKTEKDRTDSTNEQQNLRIERAKFTIDEERKYQLESLKLQVDDVKANNDIILSDQRSALSERLEAIQSTTDKEREIADFAFKQDYDRFKAGETTLKEFNLIREKYNSDIAKLDTNQRLKSRDTVYQYYVRDRDAQVEIFNLEQQDKQNQAQKILAEEDSTFDERHKALATFYEAQRAVIGAEFLKDLDQLGLTNEEKLKISKKYNSDLLKLNIDREKQLQDEQKKEKDKEIKQLEEFYQKQKNILTGQQAQSTVGLNQDFEEGRIGTGGYDKKRAQQDFEAQRDQAALQVTQAFALTQMYKQGTKERSDADAKLAEAQMNLSDIVTKHDVDNIKARNALEVEAAQQTQDTIASFINDAFDQQIQNIENAIKKDNVLADAQKKRISDSTMGEQQKANAIMYIQKQQDANTMAMERRERDLKIRQAKFDRDVAVGEAIEQGAVAAIAALKIPIVGEAEAIAIGIITTAKVAEILARPLPTYGFGTDDHEGGLAMVGDRFKKEGIIEPGKAPYWSPAIPTIMDLPKHTQVITMEDIQQMSNNRMFVDKSGSLIVLDRGKNESKQMTAAIYDQTDRLEKAMKQQRKVNVIIKQQTNPRWASHIHDQVYK